MKNKKNFLNPFVFPVFLFAVTIMVGTLVLHLPISLAEDEISWVDALFTATSATCVTGLIVVDTGSFFSEFGQWVILVLIQLGGLGIMTYASLIFFLWRKKISITDNIAVGQTLLHSAGFRLGKFLQKMVLTVIGIEVVGAVVMHFLSPVEFTFFSSAFHSVSAFCNAGFSLFPDSLSRFQGNWPVNLCFIALIILGGLGFGVIMEVSGLYHPTLSRGKPGITKKRKISWHSRIVVQTTLFLILFGWAVFLFTEPVGGIEKSGTGWGAHILASLFQSVTSRTAGFNTVEIGGMTNASLLILILLMFIGGSPASCAGGIKTTTFRSLLAFAWSSIRGRRQVVIGKFALNRETVNKLMALVIFSLVIIFTSAFVLLIIEGQKLPHSHSHGIFIKTLFECVSAFATVGLSTGITSDLSTAGKLVITVLMFTGRLGLILFLSLLQSWQRPEHFSRAEETLMVG
ncbi:MAG: TrkH family potassium uptake protein [Thermodesulfobacteriota bacterium]